MVGKLVNLFLVAYGVAAIQFGPVKGGHGCGGLCPPHWTFWGRHCYRFFNNVRLDWRSAEQYCNQFGTVSDAGEDQIGHLVSIHSELENVFLRSMWDGLREPSSARQECWMGLNDIADEGTFKWSDESTTQYAKWGPGQPNSHGGNQDCGALDTTGTGIYFGGWDDGTCSADLPFICKMLPACN